MKKLLEDPEGFIQPKERPPGTTSAALRYGQRRCHPPQLAPLSQYGIELAVSTPVQAFRLARAPGPVSRDATPFFIKFLTDPGDLVLDLFAGSNTTGATAQRLERRWLALDSQYDYVLTSAFRFMDGWSETSVQGFLAAVRAGNETPIRIRPRKDRRQKAIAALPEETRIAG